jgi:hypothetical protein
VQTSAFPSQLGNQRPGSKGAHFSPVKRHLQFLPADRTYRVIPFSQHFGTPTPCHVWTKRTTPDKPNNSRTRKRASFRNDSKEKEIIAVTNTSEEPAAPSVDPTPSKSMHGPWEQHGTGKVEFVI